MTKQGLFLAAGLLLVAGAAWAGTYGTVDLTYQNDNYPDQNGATPPTAYIHMPGAVSNLQDVYVGRSNFLVSSAADNLPNLNPLDNKVGQNITAYCVDVYQWINYQSPGRWDVNDLSSAPTYPGIAMGTEKAKLLAELADSYMSKVDTLTKAAAFQAAVWEIVNETLPTNPHDGDKLNALGYDVTSGTFNLYSPNDGGAFEDQANTWLWTLTWPGDNPNGLDYSLTTLATQDFALLVPAGIGGSQVPEPVTMFSAFMAISGLGMYIRKRMKAPAAA